MTKTVAQLVSELRGRKNALAEQICLDHDLPPMTWDKLGTWAYRNRIMIALMYADNDVIRSVDGNNYARRAQQQPRTDGTREDA